LNNDPFQFLNAGGTAQRGKKAKKIIFMALFGYLINFYSFYSVRLGLMAQLGSA
jgi:hypothetical protein